MKQKAEELWRSPPIEKAGAEGARPFWAESLRQKDREAYGPCRSVLLFWSCHFLAAIFLF